MQKIKNYLQCFSLQFPPFNFEYRVDLVQYCFVERNSTFVNILRLTDLSMSAVVFLFIHKICAEKLNTAPKFQNYNNIWIFPVRVSSSFCQCSACFYIRQHRLIHKLKCDELRFWLLGVFIKILLNSIDYKGIWIVNCTWIDTMSKTFSQMLSGTSIYVSICFFHFTGSSALNNLSEIFLFDILCDVSLWNFFSECFFYTY